jgi:hypothetical protein
MILSAMRITTPLLAAMAMAVAAMPAAAHHSTAMFDASKTVTVEGTVRQFLWTNPHSWIYLTVADANGQTAEWPIELGGPGGLLRQGWTAKTLTPGMKVKATVHPLREGKAGGQFVSLILPDGKQLGDSSADVPQ